MEKDLKKIISQMTLEEKAGLCSGLDSWHTKPVERLGIPSIRVSDGPHGLRKVTTEEDGRRGSVPAICFPTGSALAASWNRELLKKIGKALGEECQAEDISIILGPAVNIKRSPLCGRNFEYYSEDPYLSSEIATSFIEGVQEEGVGTSIKHFAANNQEHRRFSVNAVIDERALREIYLASFEGAIKKAKPWTVMCAYNAINGAFCSENEWLLTSILRDEWGFEGFVVSDWGAVNERVPGLRSGLDLEMPSSNGINDKKIVEAVKNGTLPEEVLDRAVERILRIIFMAIENKKENVAYDKEQHHKLAREAAAECMVLLKNEENILPLKKDAKIAVIGALASNPRFQGGGSSHINPSKLENALDEIKKSSNNPGAVTFAQGYDLSSDKTDENMFNEAIEKAVNADVAVIFAGLPDRYESEGYDRAHMRIPENQLKLIEAVSEAQKNVVVVLSNGSPVEMPWIDKVKGILEAYLGGQASGGAIADLLFGDANPSGKLAETFPRKLSHNPSYINFPGEDDRVEYREGIFVGYRYYDKTGIEPLFPFGHGLSYTTFEYTAMSLNKKEISDEDLLEVTVTVKNTGNVPGKEIVQLYVKDVESSVIRPVKELKGFEKIHLEPGEEKSVTFVLGKRAFAYYNTEIKDWHVETGEFEILAGASSQDIRLRDTVYVKSTVPVKKKYTRNSTIGDVAAHPQGDKLVREIMKKAYGDEFEMEDESLGINRAAMIRDFVLRSVVGFSGGKFSESDMEELLRKLNS